MSIYALGDVTSHGMNEIRTDQILSKDGSGNFIEWDGTSFNAKNLALPTLTDAENSVVLPNGRVASIVDGGGQATGELRVHDGVSVGGIPINTQGTPEDLAGFQTTGSITNGTSSLTVASTSNIQLGFYVTGEGIPVGARVANISGTTITISVNAVATISNKAVSFYSDKIAPSVGALGGALCRAWVNFDGTGTVSIRDSFNVSSIIDRGVGAYTINLINPTPSSNPVVLGMIGSASADTNRVMCLEGSATVTLTSSSIPIVTKYWSNSTKYDTAFNLVIVFG